nr:SMP-30/gluconolactonase/LRE family protein [Pelagibacterium xiamenense]
MTGEPETMLGPSIEVAIAGQDQLGETPLWCERNARLYWLDIERPKLQAFDPSTGAVERWSFNASYLGSHALTQCGKHLLALDTALHVFDRTTGDTQLLAQVEAETENRLNDGRCDAKGRFWVGTMDNALHRPNGALYRVDGAEVSPPIMNGIIVSNGIAFSPAGDRMYFTDTRRHQSWSFRFDPEAGTITDRHLFADYAQTGERPDGACVDVDGCLWTAFFAGGKIVRYTPEGAIDRKIALPVTNPTCLCFGGSDFKTLYITTSRKFLSAQQLAAEPLAGSVLAIEGAGQGLPENRFALPQTDHTDPTHIGGKL